jgi:hypothetical protein
MPRSADLLWIDPLGLARGLRSTSATRVCGDRAGRLMERIVLPPSGDRRLRSASESGLGLYWCSPVEDAGRAYQRMELNDLPHNSNCGGEKVLVRDRSGEARYRAVIRRLKEAGESPKELAEVNKEAFEALKRRVDKLEERHRDQER